MSFELHPRLQQDTFFIMDMPLSQVRLMNDERFPWLILVPKKADISELFELDKPDQNQVLSEITQISQLLKKHYSADKINVAALGNQVPQLHVHIIARSKQDCAWPNPVWGFEKAKPYTANQAERAITELKTLLLSPQGLV